MDRIQILFALIETQLVPSELEERGYIEGIFPLHNTYELNGIPRFGRLLTTNNKQMWEGKERCATFQ
jgi:hypothetical protein